MSGGVPWSHPVRLAEAQRGGRVELEASDAERARVAELLDLAGLARLEGEVSMRPWLDGAELEGRWRAELTRTCGLTLAPFDQQLEGRFSLRAVPEGSPNAPVESPEAGFDVDAPDPPDVLEGDRLDLAAYLVEHLALELDPFPRAPGAEFVQPDEPAEPSPFAALAALKREG